VAYVWAVAGNGVRDSARVVVTPSYVSVVLGRDTATLGAVGATVQLTAAVTDAAGPVPSPLLTWTSGDTAVVRVDQTGLVTGRGNGTARVVASGGFQADTATVTVSQVAVAVVITTVSRPDTLVVDALNDTLVARAEVRDARGAPIPGRTFTWKGPDPAVLTVGSGGILVTRAEGTARLIATSGALADTVAVVVRQMVVAVEVSPANRTFTALTDTLTFVAGLTDRKGTAVSGRAVRWTSTDTTVAVVDSAAGRVTTVRNGSVVIRAAVEGVTGQAGVTVTQVVASVNVSPDTASILVLGDESRAFTLAVRDGRSVAIDTTRYTTAWASTVTGVATLLGAGATGVRVRSAGNGAAYVRAVVTTGATQRADSSRVVVTGTYASVTLVRDTATLRALADTVRLSAEATDSLGDGIISPLLTWTSSDTAVADVAQSGTVTARRDGVARITVTGGTRADTAAVTVRQEVAGIRQTRWLPGEMTALGDTFRVVAEAHDRNGYTIPRVADSLRWRTDNAALVSVDPVTGVLTARGRHGPQYWYSDVCVYVAVGAAQGGCWWANVRPYVRTVLFTADTLRPTRLRTDTVVASFRDRNGSWAQTFSSLPNYSGDAYALTSSDTAVATVVVVDSARIAVTGRRPGLARVVLTLSGPADADTLVRKLADTVVVLVAPVVARLDVSPDSSLLAVGDRVRLTAIPRDSGGTTISPQLVTWGSGDAGIATVDSMGVVTGRGLGATTVTATSGPVSTSVRVAVQDLTLAWVDSAYAGATSTGSETEPFGTIGEAVTAVSVGGVVRVRRGTYNETVVIGKKLRLWGDSAAVVTIRAASGDDGVRVTGTDSVEIKGVTITGAAYNGIGVIGDLSGGPRVVVADVVVRNNSGMGLYVVRPGALQVLRSTFRANGNEGVKITDAALVTHLSDVLVENNGGNGVLLQRARAELSRVTIGGTTYRDGDSRRYNGTALAVLDSSTVRITGSTLRSDNWGGYYALVLDNGSRLPLLGTSALATAWHVTVTGGSSVDSVVGNAFTSSHRPWTCDYVSSFSGARVGQARLVVRDNLFDAQLQAASIAVGDDVVLEVTNNVLRAGAYGWCEDVGSLNLGWGSAGATVRGNRLAQAYDMYGKRLMRGSGSGLVAVVGNSFETSDVWAMVLYPGSARVDSNEVRTNNGNGLHVSPSGSALVRYNQVVGLVGAGWAVQVAGSGPATVSGNRMTGPWQRGIYGDGSGALTLRRNTIDSARGGVDVGSAQVVVDSSTIRWSQFGVQLRSGNCTAASCVLRNNTIIGHTDYGLRAVEVAAQADARDNWWGSATGPRDEDATGFGFNPTGTGVRVYDGTSGMGQVRYSPWLTLEAEGGSPLVPVGTVSTVAVVWPALPATLGAIGDTVRYRAQARDGTGLLIGGASFQWASSDTGVARVGSATGLVTAAGNGTATITATAGDQSASLGVAVAQVVAQVQVVPDTATLAGVGLTREFGVAVRDARGVAIDTSRYALTWASSDPAVASVSGGSDVGATARGEAYGVAYVRAVSGNGVGDSARVVVTPSYVSVVLGRDTVTLGAVGATVQLTAAVTDAAGPVPSPLLTWTSGDTAVVRVDQAGLVTARGNGTARVVASGGFQADTATVTVSQVAVAVLITTVSRPDTLVVDALNDTLVARAEVRDAMGVVVPGRAISWRGLDSAVAKVWAGGQLTSRAEGSTRLIATSASLADTVALVVRQSVATVAITPTERTFASLTDTATFGVTARDRKGYVVTGRAASWETVDTTVATVDPITGRVTSRRNGATTLRGTVEGVTGSATVSVSQVLASVDVAPDTAMILTLGDESRVFTLAVRDARGVAIDSARYGVTWGTSDPATLALVSVGATRAGVRSVGYGVVYLRALVAVGSEQRWDSSRVAISDTYATVALDRDSAGLSAVADTVRFTATVTDPVGGVVDAPLLLWTSSDTAIAVVSQAGLVTARREGAARITVTGGSRADTAVVSVYQEAVGIRQTRWPGEFTASGDTFRVMAEAVDRNGYAIPRLTDAMRWRSDNPGNVSVDSVTGVLTARGRYSSAHWWGEARLYASAAGLTSGEWWAYTRFYVRVVELALDTLRPTRLATDTVGAYFRDRNGYRSQTFWSLPNYSGSAFALTNSDTNVATVSVLDSARIVVRGRRGGTSRIVLRANEPVDLGGTPKLADTLVVVVSPVVARIEIVPDSLLLAVGDRAPFRATAFDSGGVAIPGAALSWASSDTSVAVVDASGMVTGRGVGVVTISATGGSVTSTARVAVEALTIAWVDWSYTGATSTGSETEPFRTIGEGITAVVEGGVVRVRPGTYDETVVIPKRLHLWGDGAATTIIRAAESNDGLRVATSDTVDIRRISIVGPTSGFNYDGINAVGDTTGARLWLNDVIVRNHAGRGLNAVRPRARVITNSAFSNNGQEGVRLLRAATAAQFTDVTVQANAGNGLRLSRSAADLTRVTIGGTTYRNNDSRSFNGTALAVLDTSTVRVVGSTLRSDNWSGYYALVLDNQSRMPLLGTSGLSTAWHVLVTGGSSVDSVLGTSFTSVNEAWTCDFTSHFRGERPGQTGLVIRDNVFDTHLQAASFVAGDGVTLDVTGNVLRAGAREWCGDAGALSLNWGNAGAAVRGNRLVQTYAMYAHYLLRGAGSGPVTAAGNSFEASDVWAMVLYPGSARMDSNEVRTTGGSGLNVQSAGTVTASSNVVRATGSSGDGIIVSAGGTVTIADNQLLGPWGRALYGNSAATLAIERNLIDSAPGGAGGGIEAIATGDVTVRENLVRGLRSRGLYGSSGGTLTVRLNTLDSAQTGMEIASGTVLADSNIVSRGQFGITLTAATCSTLGCVLRDNSITLFTDHGMKVSSPGAQVLATGNWWGSDTGPRDDDDTGLDFNFAGIGVRAIDGTGDVGQIQYRPWLLAAPAGIGAPPLTPLLLAGP